MELVENGSREYWIKETSIVDPELKKAILSSGILLIPTPNFRENVGMAFPQGTVELYKYIEEKVSSISTVELCINDEDYQEIALYSRQLRLGTFIVTLLIAPVLVNVLSSYISEKLKGNNEDKISVSIQIEDGCKNYKLTYDGNVNDFIKIKKDVEQVISECNGNGHNENIYETSKI